MDVLYEKNIALQKIFGNWVCCFSLLTQNLKLGLGSQVIVTGYPVPKMDIAANH